MSNEGRGEGLALAERCGRALGYVTHESGRTARDGAGGATGHDMFQR